MGVAAGAAAVRAKLGAVLTVVFIFMSTLAWCTAPKGACDLGAASDEEPQETELRILAGSELKDVLGDSELRRRLRRETGISLDVDYVGTLEGADRLVVHEEDYDLAWFASDRYLELLADEKDFSLAASCGPLMRSPVILGVKPAKARQVGWTDGAKVSWDEVADAATTGQFNFGMTNPASSNSGFSALVGVAAALDTSNRDPFENIDERQLERFFKGMVLPAASSRWLSDAYVVDPGSVDGLINYESELLRLNEDELDEDLVLVYPSDGAVYADYPLTLIDPDRKREYDALRRWLLEDETQRDLLGKHRRPAVDSVELDDTMSGNEPEALPLPTELETVDDLIISYLDEIRRPTRTFYLIDTSDSMGYPASPTNGQSRIDALADAFKDLTGNDESITGRFSRFRKDEKVTIVPYARWPREEDVGEFLIDDPADDPAELDGLVEYVRGFEGDLADGTGIYDALRFVYDRIWDEQAQNEPYYTSIVLMTDGEQNSTIPFDLETFTSWYGNAEMDSLHVKTFVVKFGDASDTQMVAVKELTHSEFFDATQSSLSDAFKEIRDYQ